MDAEMREMFDRLFSEIGTVKNEMDRRFNEVDKRFEGIDNRLDGMDNRLGGMDNRLDGIDNRLDGMDKQIAANHQEILKTQMLIENRIEPKIDAALEGYHLLYDKENRLEEQVRILQDRVG